MFIVPSAYKVKNPVTEIKDTFTVAGSSVKESGLQGTNWLAGHGSHLDV